MSDSTIYSLRRFAFLTAIAGTGAFIGGGGIYVLFLKRKITKISEEIARERHLFRSELENLRAQVQQVMLESTETTINRQNQINNNQNHDNNAGATVSVTSERKLKSSMKPERRTVKFANGYETADDEEYITASSSDEDDDNARYSNRFPKRTGGSSGDYARANDKNNSANQDQDIMTKFFVEVDELFEGTSDNQHEAYEKLKLNMDKFKNSAEFLWRLAKATHLEATAAGNNGDKELKEKLEFEACSYAEKSLGLSSMISDGHKWFAITLGSKGEFVSTNERIQNGFIFKEHIDKAIQLNPNDPTLHHLLGRFCYEVSQLSWLERKVASTLFSSPPTSTPQEALDHFLNAENIGPKPFKDNRLFIAKCYISIGDPINVAKWLDLGSKLPIVTATDKSAQKEINKLMPKYQTYLKSN